jgi:hypothetical protein
MHKYLAPYASRIAGLIEHVLLLEHELGARRQFNKGQDFPLDQEISTRVMGHLETGYGYARFLSLKLTQQKFIDIRTMLSRQSVASVIQHYLGDFRRTFVREMESRIFLPATQDMMDYFGAQMPFGKETSEAFPQCTEDIAEAHQCLAFGRYTACVFHLGRAMESAVTRLAKRLKVRPARKEWQAYINAINDAINKMPFKTVNQKATRSLYSAASNYLFNFKEAWRNPTMHPKKTYTRPEAIAVSSNAGAYFKHVSTKIFKRRPGKA